MIEEEDEDEILYIDDSVIKGDICGFIHICEAKKVNDYISISVNSDKKILRLYINDKLCCRQKNLEFFEFFEPIDFCGELKIRIESEDEPLISEQMTFTI